MSTKVRIGRAAWVALAAIILVVACWSLYARGGVPFLPGCLFHKFTGLYCPGCGMTRAAHATLHGDLARAFRMNPVGMVLFPIGMAALSFQALGWIMERPPLLRFDFGPRFAWVIAWIMISFMVLRNIPYWPFTLLAPF